MKQVSPRAPGDLFDTPRSCIFCFVLRRIDVTTFCNNKRNRYESILCPGDRYGGRVYFGMR